MTCTHTAVASAWNPMELMEYHVQFSMKMKIMKVEQSWKGAEEETKVWRGGEIVECMEWEKW
jgi:hypothetical protein